MLLKLVKLPQVVQNPRCTINKMLIKTPNLKKIFVTTLLGGWFLRRMDREVGQKNVMERLSTPALLVITYSHMIPWKDRLLKTLTSGGHLEFVIP